MAKTNRKPDELVIRIKNARLRQHIEDKAHRTGSTPEALVNEVFDDLETAWRTIRLYMTQMAEQRREYEQSLREFDRQVQEEIQKEVKAQLDQNAQWREMIQTLKLFIETAHSWRDSAQKAVDLCWKYAVKVGYFQTVRRQRDELLGIVERVVASKKVHPDEVGMVYAIAEKERIDRMIDRIETTRPPDIAPFNSDPPPPAA